MKRLTHKPRPGWRDIIRRQGLVYNDTPAADGQVLDYWQEEAAYHFTAAEIETLEHTTAELFEMCVAAGDHLLESGRWRQLGIPEAALPAITATWNDDLAPSLYARFDLRYDGTGPAKLLEFNADTPTSLLESAVVQWFWLQDTHPQSDQWNSLHEALIAAWKRHQANGRLGTGLVHLASTGAETSGEDLFTTLYLQDTAQQAGLETHYLTMEAIGRDRTGQLVDDASRPISHLFKLYPWEWLLKEVFGSTALASMAQGSVTWVEPVYKMLWSNKGILPILWELYPDHPNLLPAYFDDPGPLASYAAKPLLGREGEGIQLIQNGRKLASGVGANAIGRRVYQGLAPLPDFDGHHPVLGVWLVDGEPAGLGIRESTSLITDNVARFVPHVID